MGSNVKTVIRTLEAFEAFGRIQKPLTLSEMAHAIGIPLSSCHGLIATLRNRGYVYSVGNNRQVYPTRRLLDVAEAIVRNDPLLEIAAPVLVLWGEQDRLFPVEQLDRLRETCPLVEIHTFPDVGHWPYAEVPDGFNATLIDFLERRANG